jgi:hypothetical protein
MTKLQVLQGLATFAMSCEANDVQLHYNYNPDSNAVYVHVYEGGKRENSLGVEFAECLYFEEGFLEERLTSIINTVIDKYYKKG